MRATQEFGSFAVLLGPVDQQVLRCTAGTNETLTVGMSYAEADIAEALRPRVWSSGISPEREVIGLANDLEHLGIDPAARIGIVTGDEDQGPIEDAFVPRLEELGYTVAETVVLPCPDGATVCEQHDTAAQQLKDAGAEVVVVAVPALDNAAFLEAASNLNYQPQWVTYGDTTTATVTQFYEGARDWFDGALGTTTVAPPGTAMSPEGEECLATAAAAGADYEPGSDAAGYTAVLCINLQALVTAIEAAGADPGDLDVARELGMLGELAESSDVPAGTWGPDKHDARDHHWEVSYDGATGTWNYISDEPLEIDAD
jgi:ABC-type branched-subunit amino acid transport system substrate-binding protein